MSWKPAGCPTGIGSVCDQDPDVALDWIFDTHEELPWWPQMTRLAPMIPTWIGKIPGARTLEHRVKLPWDRNAASAGIQRHFLGRHRPRPLNADPGWGVFVTRLASHYFFSGQVFKGQVFGPITLSRMLLDRNNQPIPFQVSAETLTEYVADIAFEQADAILEGGGTPLIVLDEPAAGGAGLWEFEVLRDLVGQLQTKMRVGIHCCGRADWNQLFRLGCDWISCDVFTHLDSIAPCRPAILEHVEREGVLALGVVPTFPLNAPLEIDKLHAFTVHCLDQMVGKAIPTTVLKESLAVTPACGTAGHKLDRQREIHRVLREISQLL